MFIVIFENSWGQRREIGSAPIISGAYTIISDFLKKYNYKSYYWNISEVEPGLTRVDVGSWSEFFYIKYILEEERRNYA